MPKVGFEHVSILGISTIIPKNSRSIDQELNILGNQREIDKIKKITRINSRRLAMNNITTLDLCIVAAKRLICDLKIDKNSIDGIIFVTQTPDYKIPNNASLIHGMLKMNRDCLCQDVNHGCSGYIYGLLNAAAMIESKVCRRILVLVGDTLSKVINPRDRSLTIIHGDAGSATILEFSKERSEMFFLLYSQGEKAKTIYIRSGGCRNMTNYESFVEKEDEAGNFRNDEQLYMDGLAVFNFAIDVYKRQQ